MQPICWEDFEKIELRVGTVTAVEDFPEARKPAYKLTIDFGPEIGVKRSSAQITQLYKPDEIVGKQLVAVVNFPTKRIAGFPSEVLVTGFARADGAVVLIAPTEPVPDGSKLF
ncbi:MAG: tRNA-binding protein [Elusimicrobia bacterium]|nr:tRNA-binding protein [Elusimicrobiota bacterium]